MLGAHAFTASVSFWNCFVLVAATAGFGWSVWALVRLGRSR